MANTFFDFDTSLNNGDNVLPPEEEDCLENEEEYDALNDETFGALEDTASLDDWEQQHEQFAEFEESTKLSEKLEVSISQLVLDDSADSSRLTTSSLSNSVWSYTPATKNGDIFNTSILSSLQKASKSFIETHIDASKPSILHLKTADHLPALPAQPKKICTVEELEKNLLQSSKQQAAASGAHLLLQSTPKQQTQAPITRPLGPPPGVHPQGPPFHPLLQHPIQNARLPPPGLPPMNIPPPGMRHLPPHLNPHPQMLPHGMVRIMPPHPQFLQNKGPPLPPGFMYPPGAQSQFPINHPFNFPTPPRHPNMPPMAPHQQRSNQQQQQLQAYHNAQQQQQHHQRNRRDSSSNYNRRHGEKDEPDDEYAGLMTTREKQWLLNIQLLQLNTGTPYFDDYYYTIFKERKAKNNKENHERNPHHPNKRQHRNSERQENQNPLTPRVYTPLQFENSLGKLQCGSVTAPRKIIDMDIVTPDKDSDGAQVSRDSRKTKQLLLELEALYALLLKAEDIDNPLYVSNMEKLREMKQKQRLRELELAPTPEQKQEVLRLFKLESEPVIEHQYDYLIKLLQGLLQEEKFSSFLNIRKGKMLVLRLLPHLMGNGYASQLLDLWSRVLLSLSIVGRRDTAGDNILPKFYPFFKRYIQTCNMSDILELLSGLVEIVRQQESNRSTPLSHIGKSPLYFVLLNKFGVSSLAATFIRVENLLSSETMPEKQQNDWWNFLVSWVQQTETVGNKIATPIEPIPSQLFVQHCARFGNNFKADKKLLLEKHFVDSSN